MTLQEVFNQIGDNPSLLLLYFIGLPIITYVATLFSEGESYHAPWKYVYSLFIYAACIPGILAATLTIYVLVFEGKSLLQINSVVYFLPIVSMIATLLVMSRGLELRRIPGFEKLSGLLFMIAVTFVAILILQKTRIWVVFYGSVWFLVGLFVILFAVFKYGWERLSAKSER